MIFSKYKKRGSVLLLSLFLLFALLIGSSTIALRTFNDNNLVKRYYGATKAFWVAEAGVQKAIWELKYNNCLGCIVCNTSTSCTNCNCFNQDKCFSGTNNSGDYNVTILAGNPITVTSIGYYPNKNDSNSLQRQVKVTLASGFFTSSAYVKTTISLSNTALTDSYDSSKGLYNVAGNIGSNGDIGSLSTVAAAISLNNSASVKGDVSVAGSAATGIQVSGSATITGVRSSGVTGSLPSVTVPTPPSGSWTNSPYTTLTGTSTGNLSTGYYRATSLTLRNSAKLNINGDVKLYVTGNINLINTTQVNINSGGKLTLYVDGTITTRNSAILNNVTKIPSNFMVYSRYSGNNGINFVNSATMYGVVYAPDTNIVYGNSYETFGALIAKSIVLANSSKIHYDEALKDLSLPFSTTTASSYSIKTWQEL